MISVLYVDDESALLDILKIYLEQTGKFQVDSALSAQIALEKLGNSRYDVVVADYQLPEMDGIAFLVQLRKEYPVLPFIIFTGKGREEVAIEAFEKGADFYLQKGGAPKPQFAELAKKIEMAVERRRAESGRKQAEDALQENETILRSLIEHIQDGIIILTPDGTVLFSNPAAISLVGLTTSDIKPGMHISAFLNPASSRQALEDLRAIFEGSSPLITEYQISTIQGETRWVEAASTRITYRGREACLVTLRDTTRRKKNEHDLLKAKIHLQCIIDSVPEPVFVKDRLHRWIVFNDAACRIVKRSREELLGKTDHDFFPKEEARVFQECDEIVFTTGVDDINEQYLTDANGNRHTVLTRKRRIRSATGEDYIIGVSTDITERKRMETALRESEERYRNVVEDQTELICRFTADGIHVFVNEAYCRYFGKTKDEILGSRYTPGIPAEDRSAVSSHFARLTPDHPVASIDHRTVTPGGEVRWQRWTDRAIYDHSGHIIEYQSVGRDITGWKHADDALRESEMRFRSLFDNLIEGNALHEIVFNDRGEPSDYRIVEVNAAYETLLGIPRDAVIGKCSREVYGTDEPPYLEIYARVERTGHPESFETYHAPIRKHLIVSVYSPKKGQFATVFEDITRRKQTEDALRQANRKLNLMSSITRHDILNQLLILRGFLELSRDYIREPQNMKTCIEKEEQAALQIQHQITFTRDYQDMGVQAPVWQPVREIIGKVAGELPMGTVQVEVTGPDLELFADRLLEKVFYNLFENALRHGGMEMTTIRISSRATDSGITIVVEDDGIGIGREDRIHLFDRGSGKHSGLGLFLSREILSITGITITETGTPGKGARFEIAVPHDGYRFTGADTQG